MFYFLLTACTAITDIFHDSKGLRQKMNRKFGWMSE